VELAVRMACAKQIKLGISPRGGLVVINGRGYVEGTLDRPGSKAFEKWPSRFRHDVTVGLERLSMSIAGSSHPSEDIDPAPFLRFQNPRAGLHSIADLRTQICILAKGILGAVAIQTAICEANPT